MVCSAQLTGSIQGNVVSASVTAVVTPNQITFTLANNSPGTLIDEFFFELEGDFIAGLMEGAGTRLNWDFDSNISGVQPAACGFFQYKFGTNTPGARISSVMPGTFVLNAPGNIFTEDSLDDLDVCVRFQQVGPGGGLSVCACGTFNCMPDVTTTTTTEPPVTTTTTTEPPVTTTTTTEPPVTTTTTTEPPVTTTTTTEPPVTTTTTTEPPVTTTTTTEPPVTTTTTTEPPVTTTTTTEPPVTTTTGSPVTTEPPVTATTTEAPPVTTTTRKPKKDCPLVEPVADMEAALAQVLLLFVQTGKLDDIERIFKLIIKKEILLEMLLDECPRGDD